MKTVFFGDSLTAGFALLKNNPNIVNLGVSGDKTTDLIARIFDVIREQPDQIFLLIGTNDYLVKQRYWQEYITIDFSVVYHALLTLLHDNLPNASLYLTSIPPVRLQEPFDTVTANDDINHLNQFIQEEAKLFQATYIDLNQQLKDGMNSLAEIYTEDGVHFNEQGYTVYWNLLQKYLK